MQCLSLGVAMPSHLMQYMQVTQVRQLHNFHAILIYDGSLSRPCIA